MSDKDYKKLYEAGVKLLDHKPTKQEALKSLMNAGILDKKGEFTAPYQNLAKVVVRK